MRLVLLLALAAVPACSDSSPAGEVGEAPQPEVEAGEPDAPRSRRIEKSGGLVIELHEEGRGPRVRTGDWITVHYAGRVKEDGRVFGDTKRNGVPYSTRLRRGSVIEGWIRALTDLRVGSKATIHIPSALAYGERGAEKARIPPDADLVYDIEIVDTAERPPTREGTR